MFTFSVDTGLPGFRVSDSGDQLAPVRQGWLDGRSAQPWFDEELQQAYVSGGKGGSGDLEWCRLMPNIQQFGFCLYLCPDGSVKRLDKSNLGTGCQPSILPHQGIGL
jgi:hypothetical protein